MNPWPVEAAYGSDVILAAGGIGLAPLRPAEPRLVERVLQRHPEAELLAQPLQERVRAGHDDDVQLGPDFHT